MNGSVVRTAARTSRSWRMRQWPNDPTVAHLIFVDHADIPSVDDIADAVEHARRRGARAVRTSALFPAAAEVVVGQGFRPIDRLALLARPISARPVAPPVRAVRAMLPWHHPAAAEVDRDAFGPLWGNDAASLRDIRRATPRHRARIMRDGRTVVAFAISGAAGEHGYLQRLAVASTHRRDGYATDLVADALGWMQEAGLTSALVNTGVDNTAALALYEAFDFRRLADELVIAELRLETGARSPADPSTRTSTETNSGPSGDDCGDSGTDPTSLRDGQASAPPAPA